MPRPPHAVATAAYQGVAAQAANGQTIHKLFGWFVNSTKKWTPTREQKERFAQLKLLILDEISTCDVAILGKVDASLRKLTGRYSDLYGGVDVLLVGDWLQQLPVAGQPAFLPANEGVVDKREAASENVVEGHEAERATRSVQQNYLDRVRGAEAYRRVSSVVMLTENMRHRDDPVWGQILDKWRYGRYDQVDLDLVNRIAYDENWRTYSTSPAYCPTIVTSNTLRVEFNSSTLRSFCTQARTPLHRFPAIVKRPRHPLTASQQMSLQSIRDGKTAGMPMVLEIALGSVVQCTKNVSPLLKLANGSIGTIVSFTVSEHDTVHISHDSDVEIHNHSLPPQIVFIKLTDNDTQSLVPGLPCGVVPVAKRTEKGVKIDMPQRSFSVNVTQVPLVPAFSLTTEKCQGLTVEKMILGPLKHSTRRIPQRSSFYVAVTRVKSVNQLYLMEPLTTAFLDYFKPRQDALNETQRLSCIEEQSDIPLSVPN